MFQTEAIVHGAPPPTLTLRVTASALPGAVGFDSFDPHLIEGRRYLLVVTERRNSLGLADAERLALGFSYELPDAGLLPPDTALREVWREHCEGGAQSPPNLRPTEPLLPLIPAWALAWCTHYDPPAQ